MLSKLRPSRPHLTRARYSKARWTSETMTPPPAWYDTLPLPKSTPRNMTVERLHELLSCRDNETLVVDVRRADIEVTLHVGILVVVLIFVVATVFIHDPFRYQLTRSNLSSDAVNYRPALASVSHSLAPALLPPIRQSYILLANQPTLTPHQLSTRRFPLLQQ